MAIQEQEINTDKRKFLQIAGAGIAGSIAAVVIGGKTNKAFDAVGKSDIHPFPLYENHITSIDTDDIPQDADIFLKEGVPTSGNFYDMPAEKYVEEKLSPDLVKKLSSQGTEFMIADVGDKNLHLAYFGITGVEVALGAGALGIILTSSPKKEKKELNRRKFLKYLKYLSFGAAAWAVAPAATEALTVGATLQKNEAITKVVARFNSLSWDLHPEQVVVFFRNLVFADKLLQVGQGFKEKNGREAKIAFNVGGAHGGVEDFLRAGQDICRKLILAYPAPVLNYFVKSAGGIENFCTARLLKITNPEIAGASPMSYGQVKETVSERKVVDEVLLEKLQTHLP